MQKNNKKKCNTNFVIAEPKTTVTVQEKNSTPNKYSSETITRDRTMQYTCKRAQIRSRTLNKPGQCRGQAKQSKYFN